MIHFTAEKLRLGEAYYSPRPHIEGDAGSEFEPIVVDFQWVALDLTSCKQLPKYE